MCGCSSLSRSGVLQKTPSPVFLYPYTLSLIVFHSYALQMIIDLKGDDPSNLPCVLPKKRVSFHPSTITTAVVPQLCRCTHISNSSSSFPTLCTFAQRHLSQVPDENVFSDEVVGIPLCCSSYAHPPDLYFSWLRTSITGTRIKSARARWIEISLLQKFQLRSLFIVLASLQLKMLFPSFNRWTTSVPYENQISQNQYSQTVTGDRLYIPGRRIIPGKGQREC